MDKKFVDGLIIKAPRDNAPDFVKGSISIKRKELGNWLRAETDDWINLDIKVSKGGKWYAEVNTWKPDNQPPLPVKEAEPDFDDDVPDFSDSVPF
jgi:hypothetical protein